MSGLRSPAGKRVSVILQFFVWQFNIQALTLYLVITLFLRTMWVTIWQRTKHIVDGLCWGLHSVRKHFPYLYSSQICHRIEKKSFFLYLCGWALLWYQPNDSTNLTNSCTRVLKCKVLVKLVIRQNHVWSKSINCGHFKYLNSYMSLSISLFL